MLEAAPGDRNACRDLKRNSRRSHEPPSSRRTGIPRETKSPSLWTTAHRESGNICRRAGRSSHPRQGRNTLIVLAIAVKRELVRPAGVSLPSRVGALEKKVGAPIIAHNENNITLPTPAVRS